MYRKSGTAIHPAEFVFQASACSRAEDIRDANVPLLFVAGWLDSTAAAAISAYLHCAQAPGDPWQRGWVIGYDFAPGIWALIRIIDPFCSIGL